MLTAELMSELGAFCLQLAPVIVASYLTEMPDFHNSTKIVSFYLRQTKTKEVKHLALLREQNLKPLWNCPEDCGHNQRDEAEDP